MPKHYIAERDYSLEELLGQAVDEEAELVMQQVVTDMFAIQSAAIANHYNGIQAEAEQAPPTIPVVLAVKTKMNLEPWPLAGSHTHQAISLGTKLRVARNTAETNHSTRHLTASVVSQTGKRKAHKG